MNNITNIIIVVLTLSISSTSFCKNIYATDFHHIEIKTNDATKTKFEEIEKIKIESLLSVLVSFMLALINSTFLGINFSCPKLRSSIAVMSCPESNKLKHT